MSRFVLTAQLQLQAPNNVAQVVRQIQNQLNNVTVNVQVQNSQRAQRQLQQVTQQTNQATTAAERMGRAFAVSVRRFAAFSVATRAVGLFTSTLSDAVQTAINFERQLVKVSQVTGESLSKLGKLTGTITDLSTSLGVASNDLLDVSTTLLQAGLSSKDTEVALKSLAKAALAPNFDSISETAEGAIAILAQFGQGVKALEGQLGSINAVAGAFAVEASDLIDVIRRTGGVFKSSGGDLNELLALFTSVRATTRESAESIGTGLRTIFTRIQRPKTIEYLKQFGVELVDLNGKFVGPFEAVKRLSEALAGLGEGDITFIRIAEELGGFRQIGKVLPLLQQFSVAQQALNVANKAGNSLAQDAATAQQALAIRIIKVREEFLALVRSITETSTFQVMANTALSLASALIKLADSIKPLLPLLGALAAVRVVKGLGTFAGGLMGGFTSGRTFNKGGKVHHFARGGFVPGTGNRDTVPAMLSPGEFVIRKSSVKKLGAGNLAAMNENRFAVGGIATKNMAGMAIPDTFGKDNLKKSTVSISTKDIASATPQSGMLKSGSLSSLYALKNTKTVQSTLPNKLPISEFNDILQTTYGFGSKSYNTKTAGVASTEKKRFNDILSTQMRDAIKNGAADWSTAVGVPLQASEIKFADTFSLNPGLAGTFFESVIDAFQGRPVGAESSENKRPFDFINGLRGGANARLFNNLNDVDYIDAKKSVTLATESEYKKKIASQLALDGADEMALAVNNRYKTLLSKFNFGGIIQKFASGGEVVKRGTINYLKSDVVKAMASMGLAYDDFFKKIPTPNSAFSQFMVGGQGPDAKPFPKTLLPYSPTSQTQLAMEKGEAEKNARIQSALERQGRSMKEYEGQTREQKAYIANRSFMGRRRFATGGDVGTDTVPALLTPGEFVINRSSAQRIGYGNLNRMNKVGRYAKGGIVQKFNTGTAGTGVSPSAVSGSGQNFIPLNALTQQANALVQAQQQQRRSITDTISANKMFAASMTVGLLQSFLPALDENASAITRMSHGLLGVVSTLTTVGFALEAFGVALNAQALMQFVSGASSLTQTIGNLAGQFSGLGSRLGGIGGRIGGVGGRIAGGVSKALPTFANTGNVISSAFKGGMQNKSGLFSAVKSGAIGNNPFVNVGGSMGRGATMSSMSGASGFQKFLSQKSGKAGTFFGDLSKGFAAGKTGTGIPTVGSANPFASMGGSMGQKALAGSITNTGVASFGKAIGTITKGLNAAAGPLLAVQVGLMAASSVVNSFFDYQNQANKAIQEGNSAKASENAVNAAAQESIDSFGSSAILAGAAIGSLVPGIGTLIGGVIGAGVALTTKFLPSIEKAILGTDYVNQAFIGLGTVFGGNTYNSIKSLAEAQAQGVKTQKALNDAGEAVTKAMQDLENGSISAAQAVAASSAAGAEVNKQIEMNKKASATNEGNKSGMGGGFLRGAARVGTLGLAGYMGLESGAQRNARIDQENKGLSEQSKKSQEDLIAKSTPAINAFSADIATAGGTFDDVLANLNDSASAAYNPGLYQALIQQGTNPLRQAFDNIKKEVERSQKAFNAMNLGMQNVQGAASAAALSVTNYVSAQQAGNIPLQQSLATLEASVTSAAHGISDADFAAALGDAENTLRQFGANDKQINKFKQNLQAVNSVQKNSAQIFAQTKDELSANIRKSTSADARKKAFTKTIGSNLAAQGVDPEIVKRIQDAAGNLTDDQLKKIGEGDFSVFDAAMKELGDKTLEQVKGPLEAAIKIQEELNGLTRRRIELERNLADAQVEALNVRMEARDIQAKYGGKAVTPAERRQNIIDVANTQANNVSGVGGLTTGNAADIQRRSAQIAARQAELGAVRNRAAAGDKDAMRQISGQGGLQLEEEERKLAQAAKDQLTATRELIKAKEQELQITQEKNKLEKQSMESLITGDIEKFFEQQAAVGATAAIATGNETLMNQFGATALAGAYTDIQRQQEAGVQSLYGQQLGGAGGLGEQAAQAALRARGIQSQAAAQMMAGTTPEQEAIKGDIRALAETMGPTADLQTQAADLQLQAAQMQLQAAQARGEAAVQQTQAREMARGGVVYANRGIFVPRGTDTVPAMLTPGEFVVNRAAVQRGNNLQMLQAMNGGAGAVGYSRGGSVQYLRRGGRARDNGVMMPSIDPQLITQLSNALNGFNTELAKNITNLQGTKFQIKLDTTNINVNINGTSFLATLKESIQKEFMSLVAGEISKYKVGSGGTLTKSQSVLS